MIRRVWQISLFALMTGAAVGCGSGSTIEADDIADGVNPPTLSDLRMETHPVYIGQVAYGDVYATDADGLAGMTLRLEFSGPATGDSEMQLPLANTSTAADIPIDFTLEPGWPTGEYTMSITAIDVDGFESDPVGMTVLVDADTSAFRTEDE